MSFCKGCGKPTWWGVTTDGKKIPLDARAPVYRAVEGQMINDGVVIERTSDSLVSHFATCREANQFSGKNKQ